MNENQAKLEEKLKLLKSKKHQLEVSIQEDEKIKSLVD